MEKACLLCNTLIPIETRCPNCGNLLEDGGTVQDYAGPYSPYVEQKLVHMADNQMACLHLLVCPNCGHHEQVVSAIISV